MTREQQDNILRELQSLREKRRFSALAAKQFQRLAHIYCDSAKIAWSEFIELIKSGRK